MYLQNGSPHLYKSITRDQLFYRLPKLKPNKLLVSCNSFEMDPSDLSGYSFHNSSEKVYQNLENPTEYFSRLKNTDNGIIRMEHVDAYLSTRNFMNTHSPKARQRVQSGPHSRPPHHPGHRHLGSHQVQGRNEESTFSSSRTLVNVATNIHGRANSDVSRLCKQVPNSALPHSGTCLTGNAVKMQGKGKFGQRSAKVESKMSQRPRTSGASNCCVNRAKKTISRASSSTSGSDVSQRQRVDVRNTEVLSAHCSPPRTVRSSLSQQQLPQSRQSRSQTDSSDDQCSSSDNESLRCSS